MITASLLSVKKAKKTPTNLTLEDPLKKADEHLSTEEVAKILLKNLRITIKEVADNICVSFGSCLKILKVILSMRHVSHRNVYYEIAKF